MKLPSLNNILKKSFIRSTFDFEIFESMNNKLLSVLFVFILSLAFGSTSKKLRFIVKLVDSNYCQEFISQIERDDLFLDIIEHKVISSDAGLVSLILETNLNIADVTKELTAMRNVAIVKVDERVSLRATPNDPQFSSQWNLQLIQATKAWDFGTGGTNSEGKEIVIAIIDDGFDITHPDIKNNIWFNKSEIPDDGIDNDSNGYIDDYYGLNIKTGNDDHLEGLHGTQVMGIAGAEGNNGVGISGVSWNARIMLVSGTQFESEIIEAYEYVRSHRLAYNQTDGVEGAFVVATNSSFGINNRFGTEFPMWCDQYDLLGEAGVLSAVATTNSNTNVDTEGDMPTTCTSDYLIAITNVNESDELEESAGYGSTHIDLGVPGEGVNSLNLSHGYANFHGTSASCPHVTGAIAVMYDIDCSEFSILYRSNPGSAALVIKNAILDNAATNSTLEGKTVSGGRLDMFSAISGLESICGPAQIGDLEIVSITPNPTSNDRIIVAEYQTDQFEEHEVVINDASGRLVWHGLTNPSVFGKNLITLDVAGWSVGTYFISVFNDSAKTATKFSIY